MRFRWRDLFGTDRTQHRIFDIAPHDLAPGPLAKVKSEATDCAGLCSPIGDEVESAHLLANEARGLLKALGLSDAEILSYADDFVANDRGGDLEEFVDWALYVHRKRSGRSAPVGAQTSG